MTEPQKSLYPVEHHTEGITMDGDTMLAIERNMVGHKKIVIIVYY